MPGISAVGWGTADFAPRFRSRNPASSSIRKRVPAELWRCRIVDAHGAVERLVLRREAVAVDEGPLLAAHDSLVGEAADGRAVLLELLVGELAEAEVLPVRRLVLAPVPLEQVREHVAGLLVRGPLLGVRRNTLEQGTRDSANARQLLCKVFTGLAALAGSAV